jgi:hypothetical protein
VAADGEQELMVRGGQPDRLRLLLTPVQVLAQARPQPEQPLIIRVFELKSHHIIDITALERSQRDE